VNAGPDRWAASAELTKRAEHVIPNGVFGHRRTFAFTARSKRAIPDNYPHFVDRAVGCRFWDVDGNEYIDYLAGYGPAIAGYAHPAVDNAAAAEQARGINYNFPNDTTMLLAERLVAAEPNAAWAAFALNGSDAITLAVVTARAATGRHTIAMADGAFHGNHTWASAGPGWSDGDRRQTRSIPWGDAGALRAVLEHDAVAAVVLCPYEQLVGSDNRMPESGWWDEVRRLCSAHGAVLIIDDIRSGFRVDPRGTCAHFGIRPDLVCVSKALANGYPIAAVLGRDDLRDAAGEVFVSGTFWGYTPAVAAGLATLDLLAVAGTYDRLTTIGRQLTDGLAAVASEHGFELVITGPPALPHVRFRDDPDHELACSFATELAAEGSFVHPTHNWFLGLAHGQDDVDRTLEHATRALARMARR